ncbi:unnamed protein product [Rangifer tarandus platyrhynchus]|uniref:Uncharacterized protein n=1 Tax=Rangifer tarandus platyrhynchus TaxID=3082113 RepID=A0AC59YG68_RANTA
MPRGHPRQRVGRPGCRAGGRAPPLPGASRCSSGSRGGSRSGRDNFSPASKAAAARPAPGPPTRPRPPLGPAPGPAPGRRLVKDAGEKVLASGSRCAEEEVCQAVATWHNQKQHIGVHPRDLRQNPNSAEMENSRHLLVEHSLTSSTGYE